MSDERPQRDPLTQLVIGAAIEVHREMGPGLLESVYQKCLERELARQGITCQPLARLPLRNVSKTTSPHNKPVVRDSSC